MMVQAHSQQQGYGCQAMQALIEQMRHLPGGTAIILNFLPANVAVRHFYERLGFTVYEESEDDCWARLEVPAPSSTNAPTGTE